MIFLDSTINLGELGQQDAIIAAKVTRDEHGFSVYISQVVIHFEGRALAEDFTDLVKQNETLVAKLEERLINRFVARELGPDVREEIRADDWDIPQLGNI